MSQVTTPLRIGGTTAVRNRLYRAPVLEGAGSGPDAAENYAKAFVPNAEAGVGLVVQGNSCLFSEGRTSPGMTLVHTRERVMALAPMVAAVHDAGAAIWLQVGHGGLYAMEAWHEPYASRRDGPILAPSPVPLALRPSFRGVPVHVMTTDEVHAMAARYGDVAAWAREAGYDGIQLASANAKLLDQFLSPFYNRRTDEFGGSAERRASLLRVIRESIGERAGWDFTCTVKVPVEKAPPLMPRTTFDEAMRVCELAQEWGYDSVTPVEVSVLPDTTLSRGGIPTSVWRNRSMRTRLARAAPYWVECFVPSMTRTSTSTPS
jgi:2,4-dienoyl-CoA reductase-like NADH-dependent reductase (Old Yellow Enzyme family)